MKLKLKLKFKLYYIIQLSYYNSEPAENEIHIISTVPNTIRPVCNHLILNNLLKFQNSIMQC
jgi:hypothetical protein